MHRQHAITTLEMLFALMLAIPLLAAAGAVLHGSVLTYFRVRLETDSRIALFRSAGLVQQIVQDLDSSRLDFSPRIHRYGAIAFTDGSSNPVVGTSGNRAPSPDSDAITGIRFDLKRAQLVLTTNSDGDLWHFLACARFNEKFSGSGYKSYAGLGIDGALELTGEVHPHPGRPDCRDFILKPEKSMSLAPPSAVEPATIRLIIPISSHHTLFIDRGQHLHFLAHRGEANIENQPLQSGLIEMSFQVIPDAAGKFLFLETGIKALSGFERKFMFHNSLSRLSEMNLVLNRP